MIQNAIDSHVHFWAASEANSTSHPWMTLNHPLAKEYSVNEYKKSTQSSEDSNYFVRGVIYVETDRRTIAAPDIKAKAAEHLKELSFVRSLLEQSQTEGNGFPRICGIIAWAPLTCELSEFVKYLEAARERIGTEYWSQIKGFRYLLQGIKSHEDFTAVTRSEEVMKNLRYIGQHHWTFDVGVDQRQGGTWQLELVADLVERVDKECARDEKVTFILSEYSSQCLCEFGHQFLVANKTKIISVSQIWSSLRPQTRYKRISRNGKQ
jgi:L-rhamnono-1,4-lactonase